MLAIISPSKTQEINRVAKQNSSIPEFIRQCQMLVEKLQKIGIEELGQVMSMNTRLSELTHKRLSDFHFPPERKRCGQALITFKGDVYSAIETASYASTEFDFAQDHLRILSGLYGVLRPLDLIQPYRLEMGSKFKVEKDVTLSNFWKEAVTFSINKTLSTMREPLLINLASKEYSKVIDTTKLHGTIINIAFKQVSNGKLRTIAIHAKKARGAMVNYIIKNQVRNPKELGSFNQDGYRLDQKASTDKELLFTR